jgi:hypothetical protein
MAKDERVYVRMTDDEKQMAREVAHHGPKFSRSENALLSRVS